MPSRQRCNSMSFWHLNAKVWALEAQSTIFSELGSHFYKMIQPFWYNFFYSKHFVLFPICLSNLFNFNLSFQNLLSPCIQDNLHSLMSFVSLVNHHCSKVWTRRFELRRTPIKRAPWSPRGHTSLHHPPAWLRPIILPTPSILLQSLCIIGPWQLKIFVVLGGSQMPLGKSHL